MWNHSLQSTICWVSLFWGIQYLIQLFSPLTKNMHCKCDDFGCRWIRNGVRNNLRRRCGHIWPSGDIRFDHHKSEPTPQVRVRVSNSRKAEFIIKQKLKKECFGRNRKKSNFNNRKQFFQFATEAVQLSMRKNSRLENFRQPLNKRL